MMIVIFRAWNIKIKPEARLDIFLYGFTLAAMNGTFYLSLARIPLGIATALEFLGPLCLVLIQTRTWLDALWAFFAILGLALLSPISSVSADLDPVGIALALVAAFFWAMYIIFGQRAGIRQGVSAAAFGSLIAALLILPFGIYSAGFKLLDPSILPMALAVAFFASAVPYSLEMAVLTRMSQRTFGILLSLEPVCAAIIASFILKEQLSSLQWLALAAICIASIGATLTTGKQNKVAPSKEG